MSLECPYCEKEIEDPDDCHDPNENYEWECPHCEKNFVFSIEYDPSYSSHKADCLNGGEHKLRPICGAPKWYFAGNYRCQDCDHEHTDKLERLAWLKENLHTIEDWEKEIVQKSIDALDTELSNSSEVKKVC